MRFPLGRGGVDEMLDRDELSYLLDVSGELGGRLGPMLFQLPPNLKSDVGRLRDFVSLFPEGFRAAFEFRNDSWFDDQIYTVLGDAGAALVVAHTEADEPPPVVATGGRHGAIRIPASPRGDLRAG
ncbi:MAG: DUF72 domain-containing protein [Gemmatimonadetes bacterium]|nr:DUF72 domain-containing protein [Gemmatimonadota bacterium]